MDTTSNAKLTTVTDYESDLDVAIKLAQRFVDPAACDGNARNWIGDAMNNSWHEGLTISEWVARAVGDVPRELRS